MDCLCDDYVKKTEGEFEFSKSETIWKSALIKFDQRLIWDSEIQEMIKRYFYCEKFKVSPYSQTYDDQPVFWADFCYLMNAEINKYQNA